MSDNKNDNYEPLYFYEERSFGVANGFDTFPDDGKFYFTYSIDGKITFISEGYDSAAARDNGVSSVEKNLPIAKRHKVVANDDGKFHISLKAGNHKEIAISRPFDSEADANALVGSLATDAATVDNAAPVAEVVEEVVATPEPEAAPVVEEVAAAPVVEEVVEEVTPQPLAAVAATPAVEEVVATPEPEATPVVEEVAAPAPEVKAAKPAPEVKAQKPRTKAKAAEKATESKPKREKLEIVVDTTPHDEFDWTQTSKHILPYSEKETQEYLAQYESTLSAVIEGEIVKGTVSEIKDGTVLLDINFKSDGLLSLSEFRDTPDMAAGDQVEVYVEQQEDERGQLVLSRRKAKLLRAWESIKDSFENGTVIKGVIISKTKGGLIANCNGLETFLPGSQIDIKPIICISQSINRK